MKIKSLLTALSLLILAAVPAAWAGEIDGKGVWCDRGSNSFGYWFEDGEYFKYKISGYKIHWYEGAPYKLSGTSTIQLSGAFDTLDRTTLRTAYEQCYLVASREELVGILRAIIDKGKAETKL